MTTKKQEIASLDLAERLAAVACLDTVYGDLYRHRARSLVSAILSASEYARLRHLSAEIAKSLKETSGAVQQGDWSRVRQNAANANRLQKELDAKKAELALGAELYEHAEPALDPFSPGLPRRGSTDATGTLAQVRKALEELRDSDTEWAEVYGARSAYFAKLVPAERGAEAAAADPAEVRLRAMQALEHGDLARLEELAASLVGRASGGEKSGAREPGWSERSVDLAVPFEPDVAAKAKRLGLEVVTLPGIPNAGDLIRRQALTASFAGKDVTRDGATRVRAIANEEYPELKDYPDAALELVSLFAINVYVNSGGARHLPRVVPETVLVEGFEETDDPPADSPMLKALRLARRKALSRLEIEVALEERGIAVLEDELGVDARLFKLVCIPSDVYAGVGRDRGWGTRVLWTHFDGYHVPRSGGLRALLGGQTKYGGLYDMVSIARDDERANVVARFAIVRRDRMAARWV